MKFSVTFALLMGAAAVNAAVLPQDSLMKRTPGPLTNIIGRTNYERNIADKDKEEKREANIKDKGGEGEKKKKRVANIKDKGGEGEKKKKRMAMTHIPDDDPESDDDIDLELPQE